MDKSPLKTLTLEDFLESERHKLTGTLTPVTPESFDKWKKERLDKKAAEEQARQAKEATGRAMFEKGGWENSEDEGDSADEGDEDEDGGADDGWNMEEMRRETERLREQKEQERMRGVNGMVTAGEESSRAAKYRGDGGVDDEDAGPGSNNEHLTNGHNDNVDEG